MVSKIRIKGGIKVRTKVTFQTGQIIQRQEVGMEASSKARAEETGQEGNKINKIKIGTRGTMPSDTYKLNKYYYILYSKTMPVYIHNVTRS